MAGRVRPARPTKPKAPNCTDRPARISTVFSRPCTILRRQPAPIWPS